MDALEVLERKAARIDLAVHPFIAEVSAFRQRQGYIEALRAERDFMVGGLTGRPPPVVQRIAEVDQLLRSPACPRATGRLQAYCLAFQLLMAVDNRYFGPFQPRAHLGNRMGIPSPGDMVDLTVQRAAIPLDKLVLIFEPSGGIEIRRGSLCASRLQIVCNGECGQLADYVEHVLSRSVMRPSESKGERMARFLAALRDAPASRDPLGAMATVNCLLEALEARYFSAWPEERAQQRLFSVLPFYGFASKSFPQAVILVAVGHLLVYHADGTVEIYDRDRRNDEFSNGTPVALGIGSLAARVPASLNVYAQRSYACG